MLLWTVLLTDLRVWNESESWSCPFSLLSANIGYVRFAKLTPFWVRVTANVALMGWMDRWPRGSKLNVPFTTAGDRECEFLSVSLSVSLLLNRVVLRVSNVRTANEPHIVAGVRRRFSTIKEVFIVLKWFYWSNGVSASIQRAWLWWWSLLE